MNNILNYIFMPPIKLIVMILCLIPILWLFLAGSDDKAEYLMRYIVDFKF